MTQIKQLSIRTFRGALAVAATVMISLTVPTSLGAAEILSVEEEALQPDQHFGIDRPGRLAKEDATVIYDTIAGHMAERYAISEEPVASKYQGWRRYNVAPYLSATHGNRYVNNYANPIAAKAGYGERVPGIEMPPGAVLAKDSFTFTDDRALFGGALFVMEKLAKGKSPATADWRYLMILPDGSVFADSAGDLPITAGFCHTCHEQVKEFDHLFYVPEEYRRPETGQ